MTSSAPQNRAMWNARSEQYQRAHDPDIGAAPKLWGCCCVPDDVVGAIGDTRGLDVLELGCGAAQWSASLADEGARVTGLDLSENQLHAARQRHSDLPLVHANGEQVPFRDNAFDLVFCDHGAMSWGDPAFTLPEVARVLRAGGRLVFNASTPWLYAAYDVGTDRVTTQLQQPYFGTYRVEENADGASTYQPTYGEWIRLFRTNRLAVEDLIEIGQPPGYRNTYYVTEPEDWFARWPGEMLWVLRRENEM